VIRSVVRAAVLLLTAPLVPVLASVAPAGAEVQPCRVTYSSPGGTIKADTADQPTDAWDKHALSAFDIRVADARLVTDVDVVWDLTHADASQATLHVLGPKTGSSGFPPLVPSIQTYNTGMASGPLNGRFSFDDEAATTSSSAPVPRPASTCRQPLPRTSSSTPPTAPGACGSSTRRRTRPPSVRGA